MAKPTNRDAQRLMDHLEALLQRRAQLDLEIVQLKNQFAVFSKDPRISTRLGGCRGYGGDEGQKKE